MANFTINNRLNGLNPLAYVGANPYTPSDMLIEARAPLPTDSQNVELGTFWLVKNVALAVNQNLYVLVALRANVATWVLLSAGGSGSVTGLQPQINYVNNGAAVVPLGGLIGINNTDLNIVPSNGGLNTLNLNLANQVVINSPA